MAGNTRFGKVYLDVNDIVGKVIGPYRVDEYIGVKRIKCSAREKGNQVHLYKTTCIKCGNIKIRQRGSIMFQKGEDCEICHINAIRDKVDRDRLFNEILPKEREISRRSKKAYKSNKSTGIKRYCISVSKRYGFEHAVSCLVDGKTYKLLVIFDKHNDKPLPVCVDAANELNEALSHGKEYFKTWYAQNVNKFKKLK